MGKVTIYMAGNPDLYPLEYYNTETRTYEGVIPQLLARFWDESQYEFQYVQPQADDKRSNLAANRQVELISGCVSGEHFQNTAADGITLLETLENGETVIYQLLFTDLASEELQADLRQFFAEVSQEERTGMLLQAHGAARDMRTDRLWSGIIGLAAAVVILLAALTAMLYRHRKGMRQAKQNQETDEVTGIKNAKFLERRFPHLVTATNRSLYTALCFYTDIDRMARLCGHKETKRFLCYAANVLKEYAGPYDLLAWVSGTGFVLLKKSTVDKTRQWLPTALSQIREFSATHGISFRCEMNCGVYALQKSDWDLDEILFKSLQCARMARQSGQDSLICSQNVIQAINEERQLQGEIVSALEHGEILLYIQFYVNARTYHIVGGEALARWQHPNKGCLSPARFIPLMERENMIEHMDFYILEKACAFLDRLHRQGIHDFFLSCNFSRKSFGMPDFSERCREILGRYTFARELLIFELTESAQAQSADQVLQNMEQIKEELGVRVILDDFGVGFTSFCDLQEYPVSGVKLDKDLVDHVNTPQGRAIMRSMVKIGHDLGLTMLAEGVEDNEQLEILQELNCDAIQGFRFHYPIPDVEAENILLAKHGI